MELATYLIGLVAIKTFCNSHNAIQNTWKKHHGFLFIEFVVAEKSELPALTKKWIEPLTS